MELLKLLLLLWSSGVHLEDGKRPAEADDELRLVGGSSRCSGGLELKRHGDWRPVGDVSWTQTLAAAVCQHLDCGSAVSVKGTSGSSGIPLWSVGQRCSQSPLDLQNCVSPSQGFSFISLTCSDSVRLLNGSSRCSGRLQVKTNPSDQSWSSVCEEDLDQQDAEVVCRELGCGAPSVLQGALYGDVQTGRWSPELQCGGHESALLDCRSSGSARSSCSPAKAAGLTCSGADEFSLVGGSSRCAGALEMNYLGDQRPVEHRLTWKTAALVCEHLNCGSTVSVQLTDVTDGSMWNIHPKCVGLESDLWSCVESSRSSLTLNLTCSDSVRLLNGSSRCSGRLQVKTNPSDQSWSSVCEEDLDQQDAEVVCRELGCGAPSVLQGALYGDVQTGRWSPELQCGGHESALLDCRSSGSARSSCSPAKAAGLTCSGADEFSLVGGSSRCAGALEMNYLEPTDVSFQSMWSISSECVRSQPDMWSCVELLHDSVTLNLTCSDSVRLLNGSSRCSGRLQVKTNPSDQSWSSVCEEDLDQQDAEVVCRELGCGAPSVLQGALYGDVQTGRWSPELQCGGHESALLDCRSSGSARSSCSPAKAAGLTCSGADEFSLVGGSSRCAGALEMRISGVWRPTLVDGWSLEKADFFCSHLQCGSAVSAEWTRLLNDTHVITITDDCFLSGSEFIRCAEMTDDGVNSNLTCSDLLLHPVISVSSSSSMLGVSEAQQQGLQVILGSSFTISCSVQPQYPGGSFQLTFTSSNTSYNSTQPAVSHSAHFLFPVAEPAHRGNYSCLYQLHVFGHNFSSESRRLSLSVFDPAAVVVRAVVLPLSLLLLQAALCCYYQTGGRGGRADGQLRAVEG